MLVIDLQGVKKGGLFELTDPAIHSPIGDFGQDNKRAMGIAKFFETHVCNLICEELRLTKQKWKHIWQMIFYKTVFYIHMYIVV